MGKRKKKYYVVWNGVKPGIYETWDQCKAQIQGYPAAAYKAFTDLEIAHAAFKDTASNYIGKTAPKKSIPSPAPSELIKGTIAVDAACSGNPGDMEYRGVWADTGIEIFRQGPFAEGTNNIGEFLAIVHALAMLNSTNEQITIWTDSRTAMAWVRKAKANTKLKLTEKNKILFTLIDRAESWLKEHKVTSDIKKWDTKAWGEIPADFGRK